jgi:hypothetical protein
MVVLEDTNMQLQPYQGVRGVDGNVFQNFKIFFASNHRSRVNYFDDDVGIEFLITTNCQRQLDLDL